MAQQVSTLIGPDIGINDAIVMDNSGNIYGSDHEGYNVYKYSSEGTLSIAATFSNHPNGMVVDILDNVYVTTPQGNKIFKITAEGNTSQYGPEIPNPNGIIFEYDSDTMIVTSYLHNTISKLSSDGIITQWIVDSNLDGPLGLTYNDDNELYISNFNDGKIFKVVNNGLVHIVTVPGAYFGSSYFSTGYIYWLDGYIYASGYGTNKIYRVDEDGNIEDFAGSGVAGYLDGVASEARFFYPNGILPSQGGDSIYVTDYATHTIRVISDFTMGFNPVSESLSQEIMVFPNPCKDELFISIDKKLSLPTKISIIDKLGRIVKIISQDFLVSGNSIMINTSDIQNGSYMVVAEYSNYKTTSSFIISNL